MGIGARHATNFVARSGGLQCGFRVNARERGRHQQAKPA
ncbi:hypothetical protein PC116_g2766 [Phytophthora cactorum]|uniref:Uncharacterized protein n=1 Tax=Phytophthora cactorum TaxID=29920 RepID=A0A8T1LNU7_9STRA|nr:hypothetical protein PC117_g2460 [Phytophthora cactorum]KAG3031333.1 hypothetical protein PC120_g3206 [Phytophthora cactorum]KAG3039962.1 hypothetical protein PC119_g1746 [Phytophthora cactorum]KAG3191786.1 hypothetical protein C6341_g983 [Phytophthora cactorum]KAG3201393.1 hypothetical protein PC128_g3950 [Phytophthora cactorum]